MSLAGQVSQASADTFNFDARLSLRYDVVSGGVTAVGPFEFPWTIGFDPVVQGTQLIDNQPGSLQMSTDFTGSALSIAPTPLTADIWANNAPSGTTFTHFTNASGLQWFSSFSNLGARSVSLWDRWVSDDLDADPDVTTVFQYYRQIVVSKNIAGFGDVAMFDALSVIEFLAMADAGYTIEVAEGFQTVTMDSTTGPTAVNGSLYKGPATLTGHVPGSPTPVPEPASMVLVATGLLATAVRKRVRLW